ncbi:PASTA domain-containing protein [Runella sp. MFBS21]|uniref:PASTA domain-containing protein n=1 Tax=Runella sp. MFBS21 TaxID=3034018 RepID=UPI0023FA3600|nr:PASTA domain-containing protein [Runella sp. MFBS21]MDF7821360.1 PASTA domain-containing protein [Runella sp. MFBS21]
MKISTNSRADLFVHISLVVALVVALFLGFFFLYLPFTTNHGQSITVPDLSGMSVEQLEDYLDERNLRYEVADCTFVVGAKPLSVIRQHPKSGMRVKEGRKIYIYITSLNAPDVKMPQLEDRTLSSAEGELARLGLQRGKIIYVPDLAHNSVRRQLYNGNPIQPGTLVPQGSKIDLEVGNGIGNTEFDVPNVVGSTLEDALFVIKGSNLAKPLIQYVDDASQPPGTVVRQNPEAGAGNKIRVGETIDLWVVGTNDPQPEQQQNE